MIIIYTNEKSHEEKNILYKCEWQRGYTPKSHAIAMIA